MSRIRSLFSLYTKERRYFRTIIVTLIHATLFILWMTVIKVALAFVIPYLIYILEYFVIRFCYIEDNRKEQKLLFKKHKFEFDPISVSLDELSLFLKEYKKNEYFWLTDRANKKHLVEIIYDVETLKGKFYSKRLYLDSKEISYKRLLGRLEEFSKDGYIKIHEATDFNSPVVISNRVMELKKESGASL